MISEEFGASVEAKTLVSLADQLVEETRSFRDLIDAETGNLLVRSDALNVADAVIQVTGLLSNLAESAQVVVDTHKVQSLVIQSDAVLLRRALVNIVKNAIEASGPGDRVSITVTKDGHEALLQVHNPAFMPYSVQRQVFLRSFSTKSGAGRGLGTYGAKLLVENYLGGTISFHSDPKEGTSFEVRMPIEE